MKHSSIQDLFCYWNQRRGTRDAPERGDIEPGAIRRALADTFILGQDVRSEYRFRLAGTRICAAFGRELKGEEFVGLWRPDADYSVRYLLGVVGQELVGFVASAVGTSAEGATIEFELLVLPLKHRGRTDARILGAFAPITLPYWLGAHPIGQLSLGTLRYLHQDEPHSIPSAAPSPPARRRHGFVVYEGGQR